MINQHSKYHTSKRGGETFQAKVETNKPQDKSFGEDRN
jgi:hypothetical protein